MGGRRIAALVVVALAATACGGTNFDNTTAPTTARAKTAKPQPRLKKKLAAKPAPTTIPKPTPGPTTDGRAALVGAVTATSEAKTARIAMSISTNGVPGAGNAEVTVAGVVNFATQDSTLVMNMPGFGTIEQRTVDGIIYMRLPAGTSPGKPWLSVDPRQLLGASLKGLAGSQSDPTQYLAFLAGVSDRVKIIGTEAVRGVATTHYRAVIDMSKALRDAWMPRALRDRLAIYAPNFGSAKLPTDAWIDAQGRARKVTMHLDLADILGARTSGAMSVSIEFFDFGTPVDVQAPPPNQVTRG